MADMREIREMPRGDEGEEPAQTASNDSSTYATGSVGREYGSASDLGDPGKSSLSGRDKSLDVSGDGKQIYQPPIDQKKVSPPTVEDLRGKFYEQYRKEAEEYDKDFLKKHDEDLNTTLIFAGLFSAVTSAFIIEVNSELKPDPHEETAALLRFLIYKLDGTAFGNDVPVAPQWTGPPPAIVQVQSILFASLAASLFSAFLAMLGKQWLNRYSSIDMRGCAIERSQHRQRKLDGIVNWCFNHVMESLPLMLQVALVLLDFALSRYFWDINKTVASIVLGVTSFGALFYLFIVVGGVASLSFPYQTPAARILRYIPHILGVLRSVIFPLIEDSICYFIFTDTLNKYKKRKCLYSISKLFVAILFLPVFSVVDAFFIMAYAISGPVKFVGLHFQPEPQSTVLDLHCISWTLRSSLDGHVRLSALNYLATTTLPDFDPSLVVNCFNVLFGCVKTTNGIVVINQGSEELAKMSALCCLHTLSHLRASYPLSRFLDGIRQRYTRVFQSETNFDTLPFSHTLGVIHRVFYPTNAGRTSYLGKIEQETLYTWSAGEVRRVRWENYAPSSDEHVVVASALARLSRFENWRRKGKVPRWLLGFALHSLSKDPSLPTSVIVSCLSIIAIDLGCYVPGTVICDSSGHVAEVSNLITQKLENMVKTNNQELIYSKHKAISALFPYAVRLGRRGKQRMADLSLRAAMAVGSQRFIWRLVKPLIMELANTKSSFSLNWLITLASPHMSWYNEPYGGNMVVRWADAVLAIPYTEEVGQNVVDALLHIASVDSLRSHIPVGIWTWLKKQPTLPPECSGRSRGSGGDVVRQVRALGDTEILRSYLLLVWSEWDQVDDQKYGGLAEMQASIWEDFSGVGMWGHREDLIKRLDYVLGQLDRGLDYLQQHKPSLDIHHISRAETQYSELKRVLLDIGVEAMDALAQCHSTSMCALPPPFP